MKLYGFPPSPNTRKVQALALHLGIALDFEFVNLPQGEQKRPEYLAMNPSGRTPAFVDGDFVLTESNAIMQYLADRPGGEAVWPREPKQRAIVNAWMCWQLDQWNRACNLLIWENLIKKILNAGAPDPAEVARGEQLFNTYAAELEARLAKSEFVAGPQLTLADLAIAAPLEFAEAARLPIASYARIGRWYASIAKLDAWRKTTPPPLPQ